MGRADVLVAVLMVRLFPFVPIDYLAEVLRVTKDQVQDAIDRRQWSHPSTDPSVRFGRADAIVTLIRAPLNPQPVIERLNGLCPTGQTDIMQALFELGPAERPVMPERARRQPAMKREAPPGQAWCSRCEEFKTVEDFGVNRSRVTGRQDWCKVCVREFWRDKRTEERQRLSMRAALAMTS